MFLLSWWVGGGVAFAQTLAAAPDAVRALAEQVPRWLESNDSKDVAWGAYLAAQYRMSAVVPQLQAALDRADAKGDGCVNPQRCQSAAVVFALLDALIQLDARPDAALLARFLPNWSVQSLVLMGRAVTNREQALLPFLDSTSGFTWNAVANLLIETKPPGFASRLLRPLRLRLEVLVVDQADRLGLVSGSVAGTTAGCNYTGGAPGYPPLAEYQYDVLPRQGATLLNDGPRPVFYRRSVHQPGLVPCPSNQIGQGPTAQERLDYAVALARPLETPRMFATRREAVVWINAEDLLARAAQARRNFEGVYQSMLSALMRQGRLIESERAALPPTIGVSFVDERSNKTVPLPLVE